MVLDLQINGWAGVDFSSAELTREEIEQAAAAIVASGTDQFLATLITSPWMVYERNLPLIARAAEDGVPGLVGIHCEGPFFAPGCGALGAHAPEHCLPGTVDRIARLQELARGQLRLLTIGADSDDAPCCCAAAVAHGLAVSLGHHMADHEQISACADAGARMLTHLGNGLPHLIDRHHNPIWAGLAEERLAVAIIADGHHLPASLLRVMVAAAGDRLILTSDAACIAGLPAGRYQAHGHEVELSADGCVRDPATGFLVGSGASLQQCMDHCRKLALLDERGLERASSSLPESLLEPPA